MKNLFLNLYKYPPVKCFFLVLIGTFSFITSVASIAQDEGAIDREGFSYEMGTSRFISKEVVKDSLHKRTEFSDNSTPPVVGTSKAGRKDYLETTISFAPSGGLGWGSISQVLP